MNRIPLLVLVLSLACAPLWANPFMSEGGDDTQEVFTPEVRTPSSQGPMLEAQRGLRERSAESIRQFAEQPSASTLVALLGAALLYGILHAAGPGHRKTIVFSLFLGREAAPWEPLAAGFLASSVHAGVGMCLVGILSLIYGAIAGLGNTERVSAYLDAGTFGALVLVSLVLIIFKLRAMARGEGQASTKGKARGLYGIMAAASLVPCPGATMMLLFGVYIGMPYLGIAAVIAMSLGMGLVISLAGYLAYCGRAGLFGRLKAKENILGPLSDILELGSYMLVLGFSLYMAWPVITTALRSIGA